MNHAVLYNRKSGAYKLNLLTRKEHVVEKELEKVKAALDDFGKQVAEVLKKGKGEADKVARTAHAKFEIGSLKRQQKDLYQELGELFYNNLKKATKKAQAEIAEAVTDLKEIDKKIASLQGTLTTLRGDKPVKRRGRPPRAVKVESAAPKKRGRPAKSSSTDSVKTAPKRRGRPPKVAPTD